MDRQYISAVVYQQSGTTRFSRLAVILDGSNPTQWRHVESALNPADVCSRGKNVEQFLQMEEWKDGLKFLHQQEDEWPSRIELNKFDAPQDPEVKRVVLATNLVPSNAEKGGTEKIILHYSDWFRLKKAVCWILRFGRWMKVKHKSGQPSQDMKGALTLKEL